MEEIRGLIVWFTGVPGSGKSFLAHALREALLQLQVSCTILDGDEIRACISPRYGYDPESRAAFYTTLGDLAILLASQGNIVLVAATAHLRSFRDPIRLVAKDRFLEIFVDVSREVALQQDMAREVSVYGTSVQDVPGQHLPYEPPIAPALTILLEDRAQGVPRLLSLLLPRLSEFLPGKIAIEQVVRGAYLGISLAKDLTSQQHALCSQWKLTPRPELHVTLLYLGDIELPKLMALHTTLSQWDRWKDLQLHVTGIGAAFHQESLQLATSVHEFSTVANASRVAWWSIEKNELLLELRQWAIDLCQREGLLVDQPNENYFPHVTLGSSTPEGDPFWDQHKLPKEAGIAKNSPWKLSLRSVHWTSSKLHPQSILPLYFWLDSIRTRSVSLRSFDLNRPFLSNTPQEMHHD